MVNVVSTTDVTFSESRLLMSVAGRTFARVAARVCYGFAAAAAVTLLLSDVTRLRAAGALLLLFLFDRAMRFRRARLPLARAPREGAVNAADYFSPAAYGLIETAFEKSRVRGVGFPLQLMLLLSRRRDIQAGLVRMDIDVKEFTRRIEQYLVQGARADEATLAREQAGRVAIAAFSAAREALGNAVEPKDIFAALVRMGDPDIAKLLTVFNVGEGDLENAVIFSQFERGMGARSGAHALAGFAGRAYKVRHRAMNRAWTAKPTPFLDRFSRDLTDLARSGGLGLMIGHGREYQRLADVLARPGNPNALLVGDVGAGKETIVHHLAYEMIKDRVPPPLFDRRIVELSFGSLIAGADAGEVQGRVKQVLAEMEAAGNVILYIPNIHDLTRTGGGATISAADILIPAIKGTNFSVIGATYPKEYKQYLEPNSDFAGAFEPIVVSEVSEPEAVRFLVYASLLLERQSGVVVSFKAIKEAVAIAHKHFRQKLLPGSAEDLLKEAIAAVSSAKKKALTPEDIIAVAEQKVNVPLRGVGKGEAEQLLNLEAVIHERLIDQDEAVTAVSRAMREYRAGLSRKGGPIATFLFVGPTGVGKTELAKILTRIQFGDANLMLRFDMSEYQSKESFIRFIGAPDGTTSGALTEAVRGKPYALILLDEFEKSHPDILNLFLQVFDDGRLTDNLGRTVDFQNTIIIATSNAHSTFIKEQIEQGSAVAVIAEELKKKLTDYFKAELLNRFSQIIVFKPLSPADIGKIARLALDELAKTLRESNGIELTFDDAVVAEIARLGYDPVFGARPLRKVISEQLRSVLAEKILRGEIARGACLTAVVEGDKITFK